VDQARARVSRMRTRKANPLDPRDVVDVAQQCREVAGGIVWGLVVIYDLAEQLNLLPARLPRPPHIRGDVCLAAHPYVTSRVRYDAEGAVGVAPFDDRHIRLHRVAAPRDPQWKRHVVPRADVDLRERG